MIAEYYNYWIVIVLMALGLFIIKSHGNLIKKLLGLNMFQAAIFVFYISLSKVTGGTAPIADDRFSVYSNPLPHVLILTAIVVGIATVAVALALVVRIQEAYGSIDETELEPKDHDKQC